MTVVCFCTCLVMFENCDSQTYLPNIFCFSHYRRNTACGIHIWYVWSAWYWCTEWFMPLFMVLLGKLLQVTYVPGGRGRLCLLGKRFQNNGWLRSNICCFLVLINDFYWYSTVLCKQTPWPCPPCLSVSWIQIISFQHATMGLWEPLTVMTLCVGCIPLCLVHYTLFIRDTQLWIFNTPGKDKHWRSADLPFPAHLSQFLSQMLLEGHD